MFLRNNIFQEGILLINKYSNIPLYSQLKDMIIENIEKGEYKENSKIPSEQEFCETYSISRPTVRQAINELTKNGYLYKEKGRGTFVSNKKQSINIKNYSGFTDSIIDDSNKDNRKIISIRKVTANEIKKTKNIFESDSTTPNEFCEVKYTVQNDNNIVSLNVSYIPLKYFPDIIDYIKEEKSDYDLLKGRYPLVPVRSKSIIEIGYTNTEDAKYLMIQQGQTILKIQNMLYAKSGFIVEFIISKFIADKCSMEFENVKQA